MSPNELVPNEDNLISPDWGDDLNDDPDEDALQFCADEGLVWVDGIGWLLPEDAAVELADVPTEKLTKGEGEGHPFRGNQWTGGIGGGGTAPVVDVVAYHGTRTEPGQGTEFGGTHWGSRAAAVERLESTPSQRIGGVPGHEKVYEGRVRLYRPLGSPAAPLTETEMFLIVHQADRLAEVKASHDGIVYRNGVEDKGSISYLVFDNSTSVEVGQGRKVVTKGEGPGHPFRGNQHTGGIGGGGALFTERGTGGNMSQGVGHYHPDPSAPDKGEFVMAPDPTGFFPNGVAVGFRQSHDALVRDALHGWKGDPIEMAIHVDRVLENAPMLDAGSGKRMDAQAAALLWEVEHNGRPNPRMLYRGAGKQGNRRLEGYSEKPNIARRFAGKNEGEVFKLPKGAAHGIRIADYITSGMDVSEREWIVDTAHLTKGEGPGHAFRGNQHTGGIPGGFTDIDSLMFDDPRPFARAVAEVFMDPDISRMFTQTGAGFRFGEHSNTYDANANTIDLLGYKDGSAFERGMGKPDAAELEGVVRHEAAHAIWFKGGLTSEQRATLTTKFNRYRDDVEAGHVERFSAYGLDRTYEPRSRAGHEETFAEAFRIVTERGYNGRQQIAQHMGNKWVIPTGSAKEYLDAVETLVRGKHSMTYDEQQAAYRAKWDEFSKGEAEGHPFRGNQYTGGIGGVPGTTLTVIEEGKSPLKYDRHADISRLSIHDSAAGPPLKGDVYLAETSRKTYTNPDTGRRLKNPRTIVTPGASEGVVAFLDYHRIGPTSLYVDFTKVRRDHQGHGYAAMLVQALMDAHPDTTHLDFGRVMHPAFWSTVNRWRERAAKGEGPSIHANRDF